MTYMTNFGFGAYIFWIPVVSLQPQSKGDALLLSLNDKQRSEFHSQTSFRISGSSQQSISTKNPDAAVSLSSSAGTPKLPSKILRVISPRVLPPFSPPATYARAETLAYVSKHTFSQLANSPFPRPEADISFSTGLSVVFGLPWTRSNLSQPIPHQTRLHLHPEC
jgi:hypothetical protein